jgi:uncharacterized protein (TIGR02444 family)
MSRAPFPFWRFSLRCYGAPGVAKACLALQDACGADVNLMLFCCWLGREGRRLDRRLLRQVLAAVSAWQNEVLQPLRRARHAVKKGIGAVPQEWTAHMRKGFAALELDADYAEQLILAELAERVPRHAGTLNPQAAVAANLACYIESLGVAQNAAARRHCNILLAACCAEKPVRRSASRTTL